MLIGNRKPKKPHTNTWHLVPIVTVTTENVWQREESYSHKYVKSCISSLEICVTTLNGVSGVTEGVGFKFSVLSGMFWTDALESEAFGSQTGSIMDLSFRLSPLNCVPLVGREGIGGNSIWNTTIFGWNWHLLEGNCEKGRILLTAQVRKLTCPEQNKVFYLGFVLLRVFQQSYYWQ